jgi:hypothetical protein
LRVQPELGKELMSSGWALFQTLPTLLYAQNTQEFEVKIGVRPKRECDPEVLEDQARFHVLASSRILNC